MWWALRGDFTSNCELFGGLSFEMQQLLFCGVDAGKGFSYPVMPSASKFWQFIRGLGIGRPMDGSADHTEVILAAALGILRNLFSSIAVCLLSWGSNERERRRICFSSF